MTAGIHVEKMFTIDMLKASKPSVEHECKHVLRLLQLYGDHALFSNNQERSRAFKSRTIISPDSSNFDHSGGYLTQGK